MICPMPRIPALLALMLAMAGAPALAAEDAVKESFKKTEKGFGNLLRGMGQELKKAGGTLSGSGKKDARKGKEKEQAK